MSITINHGQLKKDLETLADNYGLILNGEDRNKLASYVTELFESQPTKTIYVVSWTPVSVGGFDWFWDRLPAEQRQEALRDEDPNDHDIRLEEVEIPAAYDQDDTEEITAWLDGFWYDR